MPSPLLLPGLLLATLVLSSCGSPSSSSPEVAACERQADSAPEVKDLLLKSAGSPAFLADNQQALRDARRRATLECLRVRGLARPGGVEAPRRENSLFNGLGL